MPESSKGLGTAEHEHMDLAYGRRSKASWGGGWTKKSSSATCLAVPQHHMDLLYDKGATRDLVRQQIEDGGRWAEVAVISSVA